jgi:diguanylate cyclase (GGDEF)-like protein/PAS domain S-box-containing protein
MKKTALVLYASGFIISLIAILGLIGTLSHQSMTQLWIHILTLLVVFFVICYSFFLVRIQNILNLNTASLKKSELKFSTVLNSSSDSTIIVNSEGYIIYANQAALNLTEYSEPEILQLKIEQLVPKRLQHIHLSLRSHYMQLPTKRTMGERKSLFLLTKSGHEIPVDIGLNPIQYDQNLAILCSIHDITLQKSIENKLAKKTLTLQLIADITKAISSIDTFEIALQHCINIICINLSWPVGHVYFVDPSNPDRLLPSDIWYMENRKMMQSFYEATMKTQILYGEGLPGHILASDYPHWIKDVAEDSNFTRAKICHDINVHAAAGFPIKMNEKIIAVCEFFSYEVRDPDNDLILTFVFIGNEISRLLEQEKAKKDLQNAEERFHTAFDSAVLGMAMAAPDGHIIKANTAFCHLLGYSESELLKLTVKDITYSADIAEDQKNKEILLQGKEDSYQMKKRYIHKNGLVTWALAGIALIRDRESNKPLYFVAQILDIQQQKEDEELLANQATHDSLTGLENRLQLQRYVNKALVEALNHKKMIAIFLIDIDHFKNINDTQGHEVGDDLLIAVAERLKKTSRKTDIVARLGGDEFVIVQQEIGNLDDIKLFAEKIMLAFTQPLIYKDKKFTITVSIGISIYPNNGIDYSSLLKNADLALYSAKNKGRNNFQYYVQEESQK